MKQPFTGYLKSLLLALALGTGYTSWGQTYSQVPLTAGSFTADIIANGTAASAPANSTTADVDGGGYFFISQDYYTATTAHTSGLPNSGLVPNAITGYANLSYQLASFSANNSLRIAGGAVGTGSVTFAAPTAASEVYVLGSSGGAAATVDITVNYSDGTTTVFSGQSYPDWFTASATLNVFGMSARANATTPISSAVAANTAPFLNQVKLTIPAAKVGTTITGLSFSKTSTAGYLNIMAVSIGNICQAIPSSVQAVATTTTPNTGNTPLTSACSSTNVYLSLAGLPSASSYSYQWQSSTTSATAGFTNITGATSNVYTATGQTATTYYRAVVACANDGSGVSGGTAVNSTAVQVTQNPATSCYCVPTHTSTSTSYTTINSVSLPGDATTLTNTPGLLTSASPGYVSAYYALYPASTTTTTVSVNTPYTLSVSLPAFARASAWIDFDQSGTFDANEFYILRTGTALYGSATANILTASITLPATALPGQTRMRIRTDYYGNTVINTATGACGATVYGEALDYTITIAPAIACAGTPAATTATASATGVCAGTGFTLGVTGIAPGTTGLSYQWQSAPAGTTTFTNLGAAQTFGSYTVASQTGSTDYRVVITCTAGGVASTSSVVTVAANYLNCYCAPVSGAAGEYIKGVTLPGTPGFTNTTGAASASGYGDFTTNTAFTTTLTQGASYVNGVSVTVHSNNTNSQGGIWIDYDHSGTFDASEFILIGTSSLINTDVTFPVTLTVPATALTGQTRVRVRWRNGTVVATDACITGTTTWYGETEDYFITIAAPTTCSAPPATVVASADVANACANSSFSLSTSSVPTTLGGYSYQWQSRTGANAFANIAGATTNPYTIVSQSVATDYQLVVSCQYGGTPVTSNIVSVGQNSFNLCYCTASSTNVCSNYGVITSVVLGTINNPTGCTSANSYSDYTAQSSSLGAGTTATLTLGVASATTTFNYNYGVWIDFNQNGTFDASEFVTGSTTAVSATSVTISLPIPALSSSVLAGATRIRIRTNAGIASYGIFTATGANSACGAVYNGETEDYTVNIVSCTSTATFSYPAATYCVSGTTSPTPTITGTTGGTFSSTTGLTISATTGVVNLATSTPGTYTVTYAITGSCPASGTQTVTINAAPTAGFSYPTTTACAGTATTLAPTLATGATVGTYSLPAATGLSINANGVVTVGTTAAVGTYTVTNTVAASGGCAAVTSTATFTLTAPTTATFSYAGSPFCASGTATPTPTITGTAGGTFSSTTGLSISATTGAITLASSTPGTYTVTYTVAGACGSSSTQSVTIGAAPTAGFSYPTTTACAGTAATRTPTLATSATAGTYSLPTATGLTINATTGVVTIGTTAGAGTYTVTNTVAASGGCAAVTSTATLTITAAPATPTLTTTGTPATGITLTSSAATGNQFYLNGVLIPGATAQTYLVNSGTKNGSYTVTVTNAAGCSATSAAVNVTVTATAPSAATTSLTVFPNPTHDGLLTLELSGYREAVQVSVVNALGQRMFETTISGPTLTQRQTLNLSELASGVYLLQARTASGGLELRRIVRE